MSNTNTRDNLRFADSVDPDDSLTLTHEMEEPATIEQLMVRIYRGAELDLQVVPFVKQGGDDGSRHPVVTLRGKDYIDGDGDKWQFSAVEQVQPGDLVGVEVTNTNSEFAYDFASDFTIDRAGGTTRSLLSMLGRWF
jgi:hypothetical protein